MFLSSSILSKSLRARRCTMDVETYLNRISVTQVLEPGLSFLKYLQEKHLIHIPFENLDILNGEPIILDHERIYRKIIINSRGGFCFELNMLFSWLLTRLGFDCNLISGRVYDQNRERFGPQFDHMAILVRLDSDYIVDAGYTNSSRFPLKMPDGVNQDECGVFRIRSIGPGRARYFVEKKENNVWTCQYAFNTVPRKIDDFGQMCAYHQTSPDSIFNKGLLCSIATKQGRLKLFNDNLFITENGVQRIETLDSSETINRLLIESFGIALPTLSTPVNVAGG